MNVAVARKPRYRMNAQALTLESQVVTTINWQEAVRGLMVSAHQKSFLYRIFNLALATLLLVLTLPILLLGIALVRACGRGPIFFRQVRMGHLGQPFTIYKLRTMVINAEKGTGAVWAKKNDNRCIRFGKLLRKTRMDELPQLWNVIKGDMNIIGPRPERPEFFEELCSEIPGYFKRLAVKPGLTGWAQVNNGYADSVDATKLKQEYDMFYVNNQSYGLDLSILFRTIGVVLTGHGAH